MAIIANNIVVQNRGNIIPSLQSANNVTVQSEIKEKFQYVPAPDVIPEKTRTREKKVSLFVQHMTTN